MLKIGNPILNNNWLQKILDNNRNSNGALNDHDINSLKQKCIDIMIKNNVITFISYDVFVRYNGVFMIITPIFTDDTFDTDNNNLNIYIYCNIDEQIKLSIIDKGDV